MARMRGDAGPVVPTHNDSEQQRSARNRSDDERRTATSSDRSKTMGALLCRSMLRAGAAENRGGDSSWHHYGTGEPQLSSVVCPIRRAGPPSRSRQATLVAHRTIARRHWAMCALGHDVDGFWRVWRRVAPVPAAPGARRDGHQVASRGVPHAPRGASAEQTVPTFISLAATVTPTFEQAAQRLVELDQLSQDKGCANRP